MNHKTGHRMALAVSAVAMWVSVSAQAQTEMLRSSLDDLFRLAGTHNATLRTMESAVREADAGIESARTAKLPDISAQASVSYLGNARLWNRKFGESTSAPMPHFGNNFLLRAEQVIYGGGAIRSGIRMAEQSAEMQRISARSEEQNVRFLLVGLYLQLHSLGNSRNVYRENALLASQQIALMQKRREQGVSLRNDITRYELQRRQMTLGEQTTADRESIVHKQLLTALGTDSAAIRLLSETAFADSCIVAGTEDEWQQLALAQHTGLQQAALGVEMNQTKEQIEKSERRPKVAVVAEDHLDGPITIEVPPINKNLNYWYIGLGVSYNFSSLYKARRKISQARLATALARDRHDEMLSGVSDAVHAAYVNLNTARTELSTHKKNVQLAAENYDVVSKRYENGLAIVTDMTDAANMKLDAELSLANARINLVYAYYNLKYVCGAL